MRAAWVPWMVALVLCGCGGGGSSPKTANKAIVNSQPVSTASLNPKQGFYEVPGERLAASLSSEEQANLQEAGIQVEAVGGLFRLAFSNASQSKQADDILGQGRALPHPYLLLSGLSTEAAQTSWTQVLNQMKPFTQAPAKRPVVAVLDTGVNPGLFPTGTLLDQQDYLGQQEKGDPNGHGTQVADALTGTTAGVSLCGNCKIVSHRICSKEGYCPLFAALEALDSLNSHPPDVVLMSLGAKYSPPDFVREAFRSVVASLEQKGVVVVTPSGNGAGQVSDFFPASIGAPLVSVGGANTSANGVASFSNKGATITLFAPSEGLALADGPGSVLSRQGTSFAAALVASQIANGSGWMGNSQQALRTLVQAATPLGKTSEPQGLLLKGVDFSQVSTTPVLGANASWKTDPVNPVAGQAFAVLPSDNVLPGSTPSLIFNGQSLLMNALGPLTLTAPTKSGAANLEVSWRDRSNQVQTTKLSVLVQHATPVSMALSLDTQTPVSGQTCTLLATATDAFGNTWEAGTEVQLQLKQGAATLQGGGKILLNAAGSLVLTGVLGALRQDLSVMVVAPLVSGLSLDPPSAKIHAGESVQFRVSGDLSKPGGGIYLPVFSATGGAVTDSGLFTSKTMGAALVKAKVGDKELTAKVDVLGGPLQTLVMAPDRFSVMAGEPLNLGVLAKDADGNFLSTLGTTFGLDSGASNYVSLQSNILTGLKTTTGVGLLAQLDAQTVRGTAQITPGSPASFLEGAAVSLAPGQALPAKSTPADGQGQASLPPQTVFWEGNGLVKIGAGSGFSGPGTFAITRMAGGVNAMASAFGGSTDVEDVVDGQSATGLSLAAGQTRQVKSRLPENTRLAFVMIHADQNAPLSQVTATCDGHGLVDWTGEAVVSRLGALSGQTCRDLVWTFKGPGKVAEVGAYTAVQDGDGLSELRRFLGHPGVWFVRQEVTATVTAGALAGLRAQPAQLSVGLGQTAAVTLMASYAVNSDWLPATPSSWRSVPSSALSYDQGAVKGLIAGDATLYLSYQGQETSVLVHVGATNDLPDWLRSSKTYQGGLVEQGQVLYPASSSGTWGLHRTSALMTGKVAQALLVAPQTGQSTDANLSAKALAAVQGANAFFTAQAPAKAGLSFLPPQTTTVGGTGNLTARLNAYFRGQGLSVPPGLESKDSLAETIILARAYAENLRQDKGSDWAIVLVASGENTLPTGDRSVALSYVVAGPDGSSRHYDGPMVWLTRGVLEGPSAVATTAHEMAHLFGAMDEYASSGCAADQRGGYLQVANAGCDTTGSSTQPSLMRNGALTLDESTKNLIGWKMSSTDALDALRPQRLVVSPTWLNTQSGLQSQTSRVVVLNAFGDSLPGQSLSLVPQGATVAQQEARSGLDGNLTLQVQPLQSTGQVALSLGNLSAMIRFSPTDPGEAGAAPKGLTVTAGSHGLLLSWRSPACPDANPGDPVCVTLSPGDLGYQIQRSSTPQGPFEVLSELAAPGFYLDPNATEGVTWYYQIALVRENGTGAFSSVVSAKLLQGQVVSNLQFAAPTVTATLITDSTAASTTFIKNGDSVALTVTMNGAEAALYSVASFSANLTQFGGGAGVAPNSYNALSGIATWNVVAAGLFTNNVVLTATVTVDGVSSLTQTVTTDTITTDINPPVVTAVSTGPGGILNVNFDENISAASVSNGDFSVLSYSVVSVGLVNANVVQIQVNPVVPTDEAPAVSILGAIADANAGASGIPAQPFATTDKQAPPAVTLAEAEVNCYLFTADLTYTLPTGVSDLSGVQIWRANYNPLGSYTMLTTVPVPTAEYIDNLPVGPSGKTYAFVLLDTSGNSTEVDIYENSLAACTQFSSVGLSGAFDSWGGVVSTAQFQAPFDVVVDSADKAYVSDTGNHRIQVLNTSGTQVTTFGSSGSTNGKFRSPQGLAINTAGQLVVADTYNNRIQLLTTAGAYVDKFSFGRPQWVAEDSTGTLIFVSSGDGIHRFLNKVETTTAPWPLTSTSIGKMQVSGNSLIVARPNLSRIDYIDINTGVTSSTVGGVVGSANGELLNPHGFAMDTAGAIYIADTGNNRVHALSTSSIFFDLFGSFGYWSGSNLNAPNSLARFSTGRLAVVDAGNWRVNLIDPPPTVICFGYTTVCPP